MHWLANWRMWFTSFRALSSSNCPPSTASCKLKSWDRFKRSPSRIGRNRIMTSQLPEVRLAGGFASASDRDCFCGFRFVLTGVFENLNRRVRSCSEGVPGPRPWLDVRVFKTVGPGNVTPLFGSPQSHAVIDRVRDHAVESDLASPTSTPTGTRRHA